jgi:prolycopene isomerase
MREAHSLRKKYSFEYDIIIVGAGLGGLIAANFLEKRGFKTLVVEKNSFPGGSAGGFSVNGCTFNYGASFFWGLNENEHLHSLLTALGLKDDIYRDIFAKIEPGLQTILPGHRVDIYSDREMLFEELGREFPKHLATLREFYAEMEGFSADLFENSKEYPFRCGMGNPWKARPSEGFLSLAAKKMKKWRMPKSLQGYFDRYGWDSSLKDFFDVQTMFFGQVDSFDVSIPLLSTVLSIPSRGVYYLKSGTQVFTSLLAKEFVGLGGEIQYETRVLRILVDRKKAVGVRYIRGNVSEDIYGKKVVLNSSLFNLEELIQEKKLKKKTKKRTEQMTKKWAFFSVFLDIDSRIVPEPLKENLLLLRYPDKNSDAKRIVSVHTAPEWDKGIASEGRRALKADMLFPVENWHGDEEAKTERYTAEILEDLKEVIPFLDGHCEVVEALTPVKLEELFLRPNGAAGNISGNDKKRPFGFYGLPHKPFFRNLYLVGEDSYPGYGSNNTILSGFCAAERIIRDF